MMMYANSFHVTSIRAVLTEPLTEVAATNWMLLLVTHTILFERGILKDAPEAGGCPTLQPEHAAAIIGSLWHNTTDVRAQPKYWLDLWPYNAELLLLRDLPFSQLRPISTLRDRLKSLPFIADVCPIGEDLRKPLIDEEDPLVLITIKDDSVDMRAENVPVRFRVGNIELFGYDEDPYLHLPAVEIALYMVESLRVAQRRGRCALDLERFGYGYYLVFIYAEGDIRIGIPDDFTPLSLRARYTTLFTAWKNFAITLRDTILYHYPEAVAEPRWSLLTDQPPEDIAEHVEDMTTRPLYFRRLRLCFPDM